MNDRPHTYEITIALLLMVGVACFGLANWNSHATPMVKFISNDAHPQMVEQRQRQFDAEIENVGKDAVIPFVFCPAVTFMGFAGAIGCLVWIIWRNSPDAI